MTGAYWCMHDS